MRRGEDRAALLVSAAKPCGDPGDPDVPDNPDVHDVRRAGSRGGWEDRRMTWLPRTLGALTAVYGLATLVRPAIFAKPAGLSGDEPPVPVGVLVRAVGVRDVANGIAMATAPAGPALRAAIGARIAADFGDALTFALSPNEDPNARKKAVAVGVGWGVLNLLGLLAARRG